MAARRYTSAGMDGWLNVRREPSGIIIALPEHIATELESTSNGRDYFIAREGVERGNRFSVKEGYLKPQTPAYRSAAMIQFSLSRKILTYSGGRASAFTKDINPIKTGTHPIQIPDFPHNLGATYLANTPYAKNWFYLRHGNAIIGKNDRYLHPGGVSDGCITVDPSDWTKLYQYLILCRSGDEKTVGNVVVVR
jgi:hypothetical protein